MDQPAADGDPTLQPVASLISLFNKIVLTVPAEAPDFPKNTVAPKEWAIYSAWDTEPGDEQREYFLCIQMLYPDQTQFGDITRMRIIVTPIHRRSQMIARVLGFPIGQQGFYTVRTWLEEHEQIVGSPIEFKLELEVKRQTQPPKVN